MNPNLAPSNTLALGSTIPGSHIHLPRLALSRVLTGGQHITLLLARYPSPGPHTVELTHQADGAWSLQAATYRGLQAVRAVQGSSAQLPPGAGLRTAGFPCGTQPQELAWGSVLRGRRLRVHCSGEGARRGSGGSRGNPRRGSLGFCWLFRGKLAQLAKLSPRNLGPGITT